MSAIVGWEAEVRLPRDGNITAANATARLDKIALAFGIPRANVVVEPLLTGEEDRFRVMVLERNPLQQVQAFTGPSLDLATGTIRIGMHADRTPAFWQLWRPGWGACHGMIAGTTGAGKSALLQVLLAETRHSGVAVPWLGDPENGSNDWKDHVDCYAGSPARILLMLDAAQAVMNDRSHRWTAQKVDGIRRDTSRFTPSAEEPQIVVILDEAPEILASEACRKIIARIGKRGRKWGVSVVIVTQIPSLAELGSDLAVRSLLSSVNIVMFRTGDRLSAQMGALASIDPHALPKQWPDGSTTAGLGYSGSGGDRIAPFRGLYIPDGHGWATTGQAAELGAADMGAAMRPGMYYALWRALLDVPDEDFVDSRELATPTVAVPVDATTKDRIVAYLAGRRGEQVATGVIAQALDVPLPTVSQTLARLRKTEQVVQVRRGMWAMPGEGLEALDESA